MGDVRGFPGIAALFKGWRHQCDNILQQALSACLFFPLWLVRLKAVVKLLRTDLHLQQLRDALRAAGHRGLAAMLSGAKIPSFAEWRWGKLHQILLSLLPIVDSLIRHFPVNIFENVRDVVLVRQVTEAMQTRDWRLEMDFVFWLSCHIQGLMTWCGGCACHEEELLRGEDVSCDRKGRRLPEAERHVQQVRRQILDESRGFTAARWSCSHAKLMQYQGCARWTALLMHRKFFFWGDYLTFYRN